MRGIVTVLAFLLASPQGDRLPVPGPTEIKEKEKVIRELFKADYAKKGAADRLVLARTLQKQGLETKDDPAAQFVLLRESRDLAIAAGDASTAVESIELLAGTFRVDPAPLKAAALTQISQDAKSPDLSKASAEALLRLGEDPSLADDVEGREKLAAAALSAARKSKDVPLAARCELRAREIAELKSRLSRIKAARDTLAAAPDDPAASLEVGQYECFVRGDWDTGLPLLAKGASEPLKALALQDLSSPDKAADQLALADAWKARAETEPGPRAKIRERAEYWYEQAAKRATGILGIRAEKALAELSASGTPGARAREVSPQGLVGWWKLDEQAGPSAEDSSGQKNLGKLSGKAEWVPGHRGRAIRFGGPADRIVVADAPSLRLTGDLTLSVWFRKEQVPSDYARLVGKGEPGTRNYGLWVGAASQRNDILFQQWDGQTHSVVELHSRQEAAIGRWTHVAARVRGDEASLTIDGKLDQTAKRTSAPPATSASPLTIGFGGWSSPFVGAIDDVRVYSRALTDMEVEILASMK